MHCLGMEHHMKQHRLLPGCFAVLWWRYAVQPLPSASKWWKQGVTAPLMGMLGYWVTLSCQRSAWGHGCGA